MDPAKAQEYLREVTATWSSWNRWHSEKNKAEAEKARAAYEKAERDLYVYLKGIYR